MEHHGERKLKLEHHSDERYGDRDSRNLELDRSCHGGVGNRKRDGNHHGCDRKRLHHGHGDSYTPTGQGPEGMSLQQKPAFRIKEYSDPGPSQIEKFAKQVGAGFPYRKLEEPKDEFGVPSDIYQFDMCAYKMLNQARQQSSELGVWAESRLRLGLLFARYNYDDLPGWRVFTLFGKPLTERRWVVNAAVLEWLKLHGEHESEECVESGLAFVAIIVNQEFSNSRTVFVTSNSKFYELLTKDYTRFHDMLVTQKRLVDKSRQFPYRLWHLKDEHGSVEDEECLNKAFEDNCRGGEGWHFLRGTLDM